ncbi:hypothetical protein PVAP13_7KG327648 [Panicum virgatum]|uniref:Uncharacterized protein n=1 Tax=Panicum virgatum TaxID=38727 RepID=A0A8T0QHE9_PANVG|nr:hypothetical protein PVAP13_7KG327648 [Panicum virgatum]KAG2574422.1 hypothetical protein PVAP13_7KG327648 [Panicum virgatum]KAG2574423.1 hypothetical protein PVAP13_7KG327648 [Panicum virgatum]
MHGPWRLAMAARSPQNMVELDNRLLLPRIRSELCTAVAVALAAAAESGRQGDRKMLTWQLTMGQNVKSMWRGIVRAASRSSRIPTQSLRTASLDTRLFPSWRVSALLWLKRWSGGAREVFGVLRHSTRMASDGRCRRASSVMRPVFLQLSMWDLVLISSLYTTPFI